MNPVAEAEKKQRENIESLREECDKLRARVKLLESGEMFDITQKVTETVQTVSTQKVQGETFFFFFKFKIIFGYVLIFCFYFLELEKELETANLKMQRLKEVFRKTSQEFRDVSYMLLGYRIDLASNNNKLYKLYNMYSTSPTDHLMFQVSKYYGKEY